MLKGKGRMSTWPGGEQIGKGRVIKYQAFVGLMNIVYSLATVLCQVRLSNSYFERFA